VTAGYKLKEEEKNIKNIYFANSKNNYFTNIMCKHRGGFPEGQSPIVLDTLSNAEYNIKYLKKKTVYNILQEHNNEYSFILPMSLKSIFTYYTQHKV